MLCCGVLCCAVLCCVELCFVICYPLPFVNITEIMLKKSVGVVPNAVQITAIDNGVTKSVCRISCEFTNIYFLFKASLQPSCSSRRTWVGRSLYMQKERQSVKGNTYCCSLCNAEKTYTLRIYVQTTMMNNFSMIHCPIR